MNSVRQLKTLTNRHGSDIDNRLLSSHPQQLTSKNSNCYIISGDDVPAARRLLQQTGPLFSATPYATLDHDPLWLLQDVQGTPKELRFVLLKHQEQVQGFMPLFEHPAVLSFFRCGDVPVLWWRIQRRQIIGGPLLPGNLSAGQQQTYVTQMFELLRRETANTPAIFLFGTPRDSALGQQLHTRSPVTRNFYVIPYGPSYQRRLISFPETFEAYLQNLSKITRKDLRRTRRKFQSTFAGTFEVQVFSSPQELPTYVEDAGAVAQQTYQWKLYGSGLTRTSQLEFAAEQGWLRCYVLYIEGCPAAFQTGYLYRDTYYAYETGYLPQYSKQQIGIFLLTEIFIELLESGQAVKRFDFLQGEDLSKARLSNCAREEQDFYLIPKTRRGTLLAYTLKTSVAVSNIVKHLSERTGVRSYIKRLLKRGLLRHPESAGQ